MWCISPLCSFAGCSGRPRTAYLLPVPGPGHQTKDAQLGTDALIGVSLSFLCAWLAILLMMRWLARATFLPFVVYRLALGALLLALVYT